MAVQVGIPAAELKLAVNRLRALGELASKRQRKAILRKGAKILEAAAKANVPIADEPYVMYKGGKPFASILPGFVRDAVQVKNLRKSPDLFVGVEKLSGILAYWAKWLEFGARHFPGFAFMRRALAATKDQVIAQVIKDANSAFDRIVKKAKASR